MALLRHALHNTDPMIEKLILENANGGDILVPDPDEIPLAPAVIDDICDGYSEWLDNQYDDMMNGLSTSTCLTIFGSMHRFLAFPSKHSPA